MDSQRGMKIKSMDSQRGVYGLTKGNVSDIEYHIVKITRKWDYDYIREIFNFRKGNIANSMDSQKGVYGLTKGSLYYGIVFIGGERNYLWIKDI